MAYYVENEDDELQIGDCLHKYKYKYHIRTRMMIS